MRYLVYELLEGGDLRKLLNTAMGEFEKGEPVQPALAIPFSMSVAS